MTNDTKTTDDDIVVFEDSQGNEISNDPKWHAKHLLGVEHSDGELAAKDAEIEALKAKIAALEAADESEGEEPRDYAELDQKELKALAAERDIDIAGLKTVGELRQALVNADAAE